jgi:fructan beta-fructosidase
MDFAEEYRPRFHFTPPQNWMNDPNGLVYYKDEYHLFYQHNPYGTAWGHMSWGHAVSPDLMRWEYLPIAILEEPEEGYTIFSGSAVVDWNDTSGFGQGGGPPIVAVYTADHQPGHALQDIHIAYSLDLGRTFTKYVDNPVIDVGDPKFGDPKVFWHEPTGKWIMVNILGQQQGRVVLYGSADLRTWEYLSEFQSPDKAPGIWECPDLFPLPLDGDPQQVKWVLKTNFADFSKAMWGSRYFVGDFDGYTFENGVPTPLPVRSDGDQFYAEVTYNDVPQADGRRILIGWIRQSPSETRPWTGMQSIPRVLTLRSRGGGLQVCQSPVAELQTLRGEHFEFRDETISGDSTLLADSGVSGAELEVVAEFERGSAAEFGLRLRLSGNGEAIVGYSVGAGELFVDRCEQGRLATPLPIEGKLMELHVFIDRGVVEVFGGEGEVVITALLDPNPVCEELQLYAQGGDARLAKMDIWKLVVG